MAVELGDDPFRGSSVLSLLPSTLGGGAEPAAAVAEELGSVEAFLKSMTLQGSKELLEQAQAIAQSSLHITNLVLKDGDGLMVANGKDCPQGQRPALGRKRARFSLKPDSTQSLAGVNVNSTVEGIEDPEEYFLACENLENAGKELKKLKREISAELLPHHQSTAARKHRPGILGKTPMYKHHFPALDSAEGIVVSQDETPDRRNPILSQTSMDVYASNLLHPKAINRPQNSEARETNITELFDANDVEGSISQEEKKIDDLYYSLLSQEDLDGEKGQAFLRESFQIQQIDIGKMRLPGLFGSLKDDAKTLNSISGNKKWEKLQLSQPSPTLPKSPLAAIFALQRRLSLKNPLKEQYSLYPSDEVSCPGESSLIGRKDEHLTSPLADIDHHDTSCVIADGASPASTCEKTLSLADKMHSSILKSDKTVGNMIASWKSQKLCSLKDSLKDQYPAHPSDDIPCLNDFPQRGYQDDYPISPSVVMKDCDPSISISNGASTLARMSEKSLNLEGMASHKVTSNLQPMEHSPCLLERDVSCDSSRFDNDNNTISVGSDGCLEEEDNDMQPNALTFGRPEHAPEDQTLKEQPTGNFTCSLGREKNYNLRISGSNKDAVSMEPDSCSQEGDNIELDAAASAQEEPGLKDLSPRFVNPKVKEGSASDADASAFGNDATGHKDLSPGSVTNASGNHDTMGGKVNDAAQAEQGSKDAEAMGGLISVKANTSQAVPSVDGHLESTHVTLEENNVRGLQADSATPSKRRTKQRAPLQTQSKRNSASERRNLANSEMSSRKGTGQKTSPCGRKNKKSIAKRQSLAGAGTMWQFGVRRSTRIKSRPLEYWRGERFLYGRIHDSLATVIGIKYASPSDSKLKVKSYVSEGYANLVAQAALG